MTLTLACMVDYVLQLGPTSSHVTVVALDLKGIVVNLASSSKKTSLY